MPADPQKPDAPKKPLRSGARAFLERAAAAKSHAPEYGADALSAAQALFADMARECYDLRFAYQAADEEDIYREVSGQLEELNNLYRGNQRLIEQAVEIVREIRRNRAIIAERRNLVVAELERQGWEVSAP